MDADEITALRARIRERLQMAETRDTTAPYVNERDAKGRGFPLAPIFLALVAVAIVATIRGW